LLFYDTLGPPACQPAALSVHSPRTSGEQPCERSDGYTVRRIETFEREVIPSIGKRYRLSKNGFAWISFSN